MRTLVLVALAVAAVVVLRRTDSDDVAVAARVEAPALRDARVLPAVLAVTQRPARPSEPIVDLHDDFLEVDDVETEGDGLTIEQRWESAIATLEDLTPRGYGLIQGRVDDAANGEPLVGVTIVAEREGGGVQHVVITDENGHYKLELIPEGTYTTTFYYLSATYLHEDIEVASREATPVYVAMARPTSEPLTIVHDEAPVLEGHSTVYLAAGIDVDDLADSKPSDSDPDAIGIALRGVTSVEHRYEVEAELWQSQLGSLNDGEDETVRYVRRAREIVIPVKIDPQ